MKEYCLFFFKSMVLALREAVLPPPQHMNKKPETDPYGQFPAFLLFVWNQFLRSISSRAYGS